LDAWRSPPQRPTGTGEDSPSGLDYFGGSLRVACLRGQRLYQIPVFADGSLGDPAPLFIGQYGRLRTVASAPDGTLWFTTSKRATVGGVRASATTAFVRSGRNPELPAFPLDGVALLSSV
jgi:hypothetical protein